MVIAIDFDGTITSTNCYPQIGELRPYAVEAIKIFRKQGINVFFGLAGVEKNLKRQSNAWKNKG